MSFDLSTYKRTADRLGIEDIDLDAFRARPLAPEHLRCLRYMHDVENHTSCYLRNLLNTRAHHDPETFGVVNEWTTQAGYVRLAAAARHPVLDELLKRIMRQEGAHIAFYRSHAVERLEASAAAQRTSRRMVRALWSPVGASVMPEAETQHLVRTLFSGPEGVAVAERIDRRVDALPGLAGLDLMAGALARYG